jgi:uncharacterized membrane protein
MILSLFSIVAVILVALVLAAHMKKKALLNRTLVCESVEINLPLRAVFDHWTAFENFPHFMEGVQEVRQVDHKHLYWRAEVAGSIEEWEVAIDEQIPDQTIAWTSYSIPPTRVKVGFRRLSRSRTKVMVETLSSLGDPGEGNDTQLGVIRNNLRKSLRRCKELLEGGRGALDFDPPRRRRATGSQFP